MLIRPEQPGDVDAIHRLNEEVFGQPGEAILVDALRENGALSYSIVAVENEAIVGHLALSPVTITDKNLSHDAIGLGPMAVKPDHQNQGIGSKLIRYWLDKFDVEKYNLVVVLGHPNFYSKFGFAPSKVFNIRWEQDVPDEVFMVKELKQGALSAINGIVKYHPAFNNV